MSGGSPSRAHRRRTMATGGLKTLFGRYHEYMPLWNDAEGKPGRRRKAVLGVLGVSLAVILVVSLLLWGGDGRGRVQGEAVREESGWVKPAGLSVVALVFYGRRANVQILERYLRKNLVDNGGVLDRVHFVSQVRHPEDHEFLKTILASNPRRYTYRDFGEMDRFGDYRGLWDHDIDPDTIYIKIDDDIVFVGDNAIPNLVEYKVSHPEHLFVSGNVVNHPRLQKLHNAHGTVVPFAPEFRPVHATHDWRISPLPDAEIEEMENVTTDWVEPPEYRHQWLPMREANIDDCPLRTGLSCSGLAQWMCGAIAHYNLFYHLENGNEKVYDFGVWDIHGLAYDRWSVNFFAAWGHEIISARPIPEDDELHLSSTYPKSIKKHCVALGSALAAHLSYYWQADVVNRTDVLDRYKALVIDRVGSDLLLYDI